MFLDRQGMCCNMYHHSVHESNRGFSLAIISMRKRELVDLLWLYCGFLCSVSLPRSAMSWV